MMVFLISERRTITNIYTVIKYLVKKTAICLIWVNCILKSPHNCVRSHNLKKMKAGVYDCRLDLE